jgi:hypothetical protein
MKKILITAAFIGAASLGGAANAQIPTDLFAAFTRCDNSFFKQLARQPIAKMDATLLDQGDGIAWIKVPNRTGKGTTRVRLPANTTLAGLPVIAYLDDVTDLEFAGMYYTWGFVIQAPLEATRRALLPHIYQPNRLHQDDDVYARVDVKQGDAPWQEETRPASQAVGQYRTERVFLLENDDDTTEQTLVSCNLQGKVTADILREIRPDIPANQYPKSINKL